MNTKEICFVKIALAVEIVFVAIGSMHFMYGVVTGNIITLLAGAFCAVVCGVCAFMSAKNWARFSEIAVEYENNLRLIRMNISPTNSEISMRWINETPETMKEQAGNTE